MPVLSFCATGAGLYVQKGVIGIHFTGEHAAKFQVCDSFFKVRQIINDSFNRFFIVFFDRHQQQFFCVAKAAFQIINGVNNAFKLAALFTQGLSFFGLSQIFGFSSSLKTSTKRSLLTSKSKIPPKGIATAFQVGYFVFDRIYFLHEVYLTNDSRDQAHT